MRNTEITIIRTFNPDKEKMKKAIDILVKAIINDLIEKGEIDDTDNSRR